MEPTKLGNSSPGSSGPKLAAQANLRAYVPPPMVTGSACLPVNSLYAPMSAWMAGWSGAT